MPSSGITAEFRVDMLALTHNDSIWARSIFDKILDIVYPAFCYGCGEILSFSNYKYLCKACHEEIMTIDKVSSCLRCASPLGKFVDSNKNCQNCRNRQFSFTRAISFAKYEGVLRELIHNLKYKNEKTLAQPLGVELAYRIINEEIIDKVDCIIPVPLHCERLKARGYNQSLEIANCIGCIVKLPVESNILVKTKATPPQVSLSREERIVNQEGAFVATNEKSYKSCLLIDDVITTGATASICAKELRFAGFNKIYAASVAR